MGSKGVLGKKTSTHLHHSCRSHQLQEEYIISMVPRLKCIALFAVEFGVTWPLFPEAVCFFSLTMAFWGGFKCFGVCIFKHQKASKIENSETDHV